jgi:hypothetical protein
MIDDVQIFSRVLSAPEISVAMNQALILNPIANTNLTVGQTLTLSNTVVDPYAPTRTLAWILAN